MNSRKQDMMKVNQEELKKKLNMYGGNTSGISVKIPTNTSIQRQTIGKNNGVTMFPVQKTNQKTPFLQKQLMNPVNQKPLAPKPNLQANLKESVECNICKKKMLSKYLKYHMEASHSNSSVSVQSLSSSLPAPAGGTPSLPPPRTSVPSSISSVTSSKQAISPLSAQPKTTCTHCRQPVFTKYLNLHMSQYHRDLMLEQVKQPQTQPQPGGAQSQANIQTIPKLPMMTLPVVTKTVSAMTKTLPSMTRALPAVTKTLPAATTALLQRNATSLLQRNVRPYGKAAPVGGKVGNQAGSAGSKGTFYSHSSLRSMKPAHGPGRPPNSSKPVAPPPPPPGPPPPPAPVLEPCPTCQEPYEAKNMPLHEIQVHAPKEDCLSCKIPIPCQLMELHWFYFHPPVQSNAVNTVEEGEPCELCDSRVLEGLTEHYLVEHDVRIIEEEPNPKVETNLSKEDPTDPTESPVKFKMEVTPTGQFCHHCQKSYDDKRKLQSHMHKVHLKTCRLCQISKLVQDHKVNATLKQSDVSFQVKDEKVAVQKPHEEEIKVNYDDFYPAREVKMCTECEDDFYWRDFDHNCSMAAQGIRCLAGNITYGSPPVKCFQNTASVYEIVPGTVAASSVQKEARGVVIGYINNIVHDILNAALGIKKFTEPDENENEIDDDNQRIQFTSQILAYRLLTKRKKLPNILLRAAIWSNFRSGPMDDLRKLNAVFVAEYSEELEKEVTDDRNRIREEIEEMQEEALKEIVKDKTDLSSYFNVNTSMNISYATKPFKPAPQKKKNLFSNIKAIKQPFVLNPNLNSSPGDFNTPSGSGLNLEDKGYLKKIKLQQEKRDEKFARMMGSSSVPPTPSQPLKDLYKTESPKPEVGRNIETMLVNNPAVSVNRMEPPPPPPPLSPRSAQRKSHDLQRLKGLGLTVSMPGQASHQAPLQAPHSNTGSSLSKAADLNSSLGRQFGGEPDFRQTSSLNRSLPMSSSSPSSGHFMRPSQSRLGQSFPREVPPPPPVAPLPSLAESSPYMTFSDSQKLQLKSQILAYRLLSRGEPLAAVVCLAATSRSLRSLGLPKEEMRNLSSAFNMEYSSLV